MAINLDEIITTIILAAVVVTVAAAVVGLIGAAVALENDEEYLDKWPEREEKDEQRDCDLSVLQKKEKQRE